MATIKTIKGELTIVTEGLHVGTIITKKSDLQKAIATSKAHQWLIIRAASKGKNKIAASNQLPSTETQDFVLYGFYRSIKLAIEQMVEFEGLAINEAIAMGNTLIKGNKIVSDSQLVMESVKDALRYGKLAGVI
jgi:hypothetical protein